jgi:hypothetical protein
MEGGFWPKAFFIVFGPATTFQTTTTLSVVIPSEAEGSAVLRTFLGYVFRSGVETSALATAPRTEFYFEPSSSLAIANNLLTVFQFRPVDAHCSVFSILTREIFG